MKVLRALLLVVVSVVLSAIVGVGANMLLPRIWGSATPWASAVEHSALLAAMLSGYAVLAMAYPRWRLAIALVYLPVIFVVLILIGVEISYRMRGDGF